ncbi:hypothetical protein Q9R08_05095 [Microbacterium sp. QXD-8]|uniref:Uncharacterized protein n=1 Tax=Microbacterium psychrotolerans TaxID=3068321 RepID=A0ABU0Z0J7_9MICO|nr:hypothetical protein [Microbacterium sp. QXD-8]MDQ7877349.1 hypothetical protein [Microbacterium sp. QXD-8]
MARSESAEERLLRAIFGERTRDLTPCVRGCTRPVDGEEQPRPARYGMLCGSCYWRILYRLAEAPKILVALRSAMIPLGAGALEGRVDGTKEPPLPFRDDAMDTADEFWNAIIRWAAEQAAALTIAGYTLLDIPVPVSRLAGKWWETGEEGEPVRMTPPRSLDAAAAQIAEVCLWLRTHGEEVAHLDTVADYHDSIVRTIGRYRSRAGLVPPRGRAKSHPCPVCGATSVDVSSPDVGPLVVRCRKCHQVFPDASGVLIEMEVAA